MENLTFSKTEKQQLLDSYQKEGYVFIPGFLQAEELEEVRKTLIDVLKNKESKIPEEKLFFEEKGNPDTLKQIQQLFDYHPIFYQMMYRSKFSALAALLLGEKEVGKNMQYFNKPPKIGKPTPPHQDGYYFMLEPPEAITMWLALEEVDEENGCIRYVPGSHLRGMRPHSRTATLGFSQGIADYGDADYAREKAFPAQPGDLLVHHALTIHRADGNNSTDRTRKALGFIYYAEHAKENKLCHEAYQRQLLKEMKMNEKKESEMQ